MYSEGGGHEGGGGLSSENETTSTATADITKRELLRAIDVRLVAVKHDLTMACARASAAGFTLDNVSELLLFAKHFGADRLTDSCTRFISLCQRHPESISHQRPESTSHQHALSSLPTHLKGFNDGNLRSSASSDMSIDEPEVEPSCSTKPMTSNVSRPNPADKMSKTQTSQHAAAVGADPCLQPKPTGQSLVGKDVDNTTEEAPSSASDETRRSGGRSLRRLSVQDRINLFETKQKEQSPSPTVISNSTSGGANRVGGKPELRRLPSDASEKLVLRRWSGASDMSIDITNSDSTSCNDGKDSLTISSSVNSYAQTSGKTENETNQLNDTAISLPKLGFNVIPDSTTPSSITYSDAQVGTFPKDRKWADSTIPRKDARASTKQQVPDIEKDDRSSQTKVDASLTKLRQVELNDQVASVTKSKLIPGSSTPSSMKYQEASASGIQFKDVFEEQVQVKDCTVLQLPPRAVTDGVKQAAQKNRVSLTSQRRDLTRPNLHVNDQPEMMIKFNTYSVKTEGVEAKSKDLLDSNSQIKLSLGTTDGLMPRNDPPLASPPRRRAVPGKEKEVTKEATLQMTPEAVWPETYALDQPRKLPGKSDLKLLNQDNAAVISLRNKSNEGADMFYPHSTSSTEHVQELRPSKGNQERNDVLQMKAVELEKLFAAHKLRIHSDQSSSRRSKPIDGEVVDLPQTRLTEDVADKLQEKKLLRKSRSNISELDTKLPLKMAYSTEYNSNTKQGLGDMSSSNEVRGKFYAKYMQRRDAKLREEWESKTPQKEAKMKAMFDSLERSHAEMKAKFTGSANQHNLDSSRHHAEKIKYSKARSALKTKGQIVENLQREEEELQEHYKHFPSAQVIAFNDTSFDNEVTISNTSKKLSSSKLAASSTIRTTAGSVPRPTMKGSNSGSIKHRTQPENPLAQSVPNFSYFTKENMKPSIGLSKITPSSQSRNTTRTKGSDNHVELGELSPLNFDIANKSKLLKISKEKTEPVVSNKIRSSRDLRPFLRKGDGVGPGSRAGILKMKSSMASEILISDEESEGLADHLEDCEGDIETLSFSIESDSEKSKVIQEIGKFGYSESENGDVLTSLTQGDCSLLDISSNSKFDSAAGTVPGSPGESPGSWNSVQDSFSCNQEASDIDASIDSPTGSRASWNSQHPSETVETDNGRMRKKWGRPQVPVLVQNDSDVPKGIKRLLKFGRKVKGTEFLNDGVSASTASEGDDDTEDCYDLANRSSDDLRKSRMGYPVASYDGFTESDVYPEQVQPLNNSIPHSPANFRPREEHISGSSLKAPRSFFSLSSFRSKGNEPKLR